MKLEGKRANGRPKREKNDHFRPLRSSLHEALLLLTASSTTSLWPHAPLPLSRGVVAYIYISLLQMQISRFYTPLRLLRSVVTYIYRCLSYRLIIQAIHSVFADSYLQLLNATVTLVQRCCLYQSIVTDANLPLLNATAALVWRYIPCIW